MSPSPLQWITTNTHQEAHVQHQLARTEVDLVIRDFDQIQARIGRQQALRVLQAAKRDLVLAEQRHWGSYHQNELREVA